MEMRDSEEEESDKVIMGQRPWGPNSVIGQGYSSDDVTHIVKVILRKRTKENIQYTKKH